ncbi:hypothetical protein [Imhoffiella purpurea]|nr:hypothetical protein [Imhoffiella purpurea]
MGQAKISKSADYMAFLAFIDTLERFDILILEARHTQVNIAHQLRLPTLYRVLRFEEDFLWGKWRDLSANWREGASEVAGGPEDGQGFENDKKPIDPKPPQEAFHTWKKLFSNPSFSSRTCAEEAILRLPPDAKISVRPDVDGLIQNRIPPANDGEEGRKAFSGYNVRSHILLDLRHELNLIWSAGAWSVTQKRQYRLLGAIQSLKRDMLRDKIEFYRQGLKVFDPSYSKCLSVSNPIGRFLLIRTAFLGRTRVYVERLGDLQGQFARDLDMGLRDQPRPLIERRREQGIYSGFLSDSCRDMQTEIQLLFGSMGVCKPSGFRTVMHRWTHDYSSHNNVYYTECKRRQPRLKDSSSDAGDLRVGFINTSYWMIERPDLQPVIAHEIAHLALMDYYGELYSPRLSVADDPFARLLRSLSHCLTTYELESKPEVGNEARPRHVLTEIAADLIASAIVGPAYLLAAFFQDTGAHLEELFRQPDERIDIDLIDYIEDRGHNQLLDYGRTWYLRSLIVCAWLNAIQHRNGYDLSKLETTLIEGVEEASKRLFKQLAELRGVELAADRYWRRLGERLCTLVRRSEAAREVCKWRKKRGDDYGTGDSGEGHRGPRLQPRSTRRIPKEVRNLLFRRLIDFKSLDDQPLRDLSDDLAAKGEAFNSLYLNYRRFDFDSGFSADFNEIRIANRPLFQHHYDIPWQCALMRAIDFVGPELAEGKERKLDTGDWERQIHEQTTLGRDLYQIGLEFHFWRMRSSFHRFGIVFRLLTEFFWDFTARELPVNDPLYQNLACWMFGDAIGGDQDKDGQEKKEWTRNRLEDYIAAYDRLVFAVYETNQNSQSEIPTKFKASWFDDLFGEYRAGMFRIDEKLKDDFDQFLGKVCALDLLRIHPGSALLFFRDKSDASGEACVADPVIEPASQEQRFLEKLQGKKLAELFKILDDALPPSKGCSNESWVLLEPIRGFISMHEDVGQSIRALTNGLKNGALNQGCESISPQIVMVTRIYLSGSYFHFNDTENQNLSSKMREDLFTQGYWRDWVQESSDEGCRTPAARHYFGLLGVPDLLSLQIDSPMCRCRLPQFFAFQREFENNKTNSAFKLAYIQKRPDWEVFPTFFARRELALPISLSNPDKPSANKNGGIPKKILGVLSVTLKQRDLRLYFLHRLLRSVKKKKEWSDFFDSSPTGSTRLASDLLPLDAAGEYLDDCDLVLLGEGWGDIVIVFSWPESNVDVSDKMASLYKIDQILFHDFQVDRTDLSLSAGCAVFAARDERFSIAVQFRLMEDRGLSFSSHEFSRRALDVIKKKGWGGNCRLGRMPGGRMDFTLHLFGKVYNFKYSDLFRIVSGGDNSGSGEAYLERNKRNYSSTVNNKDGDVANYSHNAIDLIETTIIYREDVASNS